MAEISWMDRVRGRIQARIGLPFEHRVRAPLRRLRNASRSYRPIFVTGAAGGGTSVMAVALAQRFDAAGLVYECDSQISHGSFLHVPPLSSYGSVAEYERRIAPDAAWSVEHGRHDVQQMLRAYATGPGEAVVAKGPDIHLVRAAFLERCFPEAGFVAIVRDPAANLEGLRRKWPLFGRDRLEACIGFYRWIHESYLDQTATFRERALVVDYADLVSRPAETLAAVAERLGLQPARRRVRLPDAPNVEGPGIRNLRGNRVEMVTDADRRARARLTPEEAAAIDAALAPLRARIAAETLRP